MEHRASTTTKNGKMFACNSIEKWSADHSKVIHQIKLQINFPFSILFHSIGNKISWGMQARLLLPRREIVNKAKLKRLILKSTFFLPSFSNSMGTCGAGLVTNLFHSTIKTFLEATFGAKFSCYLVHLTRIVEWAFHFLLGEKRGKVK